VRRKGGFSWASSNGLLVENPAALGSIVAAALDADNRVALAFECPLSVPVPGVGEGDGAILVAPDRERATVRGARVPGPAL
jgi:hypothetical protein